MLVRAGTVDQQSGVSWRGYLDDVLAGPQGEGGAAHDEADRWQAVYNVAPFLQPPCVGLRREYHPRNQLQGHRSLRQCITPALAKPSHVSLKPGLSR